MKPHKNQPTIDFYALFCTAFEHFNASLFSGSLPPVIITMQRTNQTMGYFSKDRWTDAHGKTSHEIAVNPAYFASHKLIEILQTIVHEQCHLWQEEFGKPSRRTYHNQEWADKMESLGLMPSSTGMPGGRRTGQRMADYPIKGGAFLQACNALLAEGFKLNWIDRFPVRNLQIESIKVSDTTIGTDEVQKADGLGEGLPELHTLVSDLISNIAVSEPHVELQAKKNNKVKYRCQCNNNVWGKPSLKIRCDDCEEIFQETLII